MNQTKGGRNNEFFTTKIFSSCCRIEHMTKAAQELNVSQPALSNTIARLEEQVLVSRSLTAREGKYS